MMPHRIRPVALLPDVVDLLNQQNFDLVACRGIALYTVIRKTDEGIKSSRALSLTSRVLRNPGKNHVHYNNVHAFIQRRQRNFWLRTVIMFHLVPYAGGRLCFLNSRKRMRRKECGAKEPLTLHPVLSCLAIPNSEHTCTSGNYCSHKTACLHSPPS